MNRIRNMIFMIFMFSLVVFFTAQAQVDDTTDVDRPADTEFGIPADTETGTEGTDIELGAPTTGTQNDTTGKYAAHYRLAEEMGERLGQSVALSEEQKNDVIKRIIEFQEEIADVNMEMRVEGENTNTQNDLDAELVSLVDDIEDIMDENQRAEWIRMKNDWMTEVKAHIQSERDVMQQERDNYSR